MGHQWCFLGSRGVSGLATSDSLAQMTQLAVILRKLPFRQLNCTSSTQDKWQQKCLYPWVSLLILQQPIRVRLLWWLLKLWFKIGRPLCSCFPAAMTSLFGYLFNSVYSHSFSFLTFFFFFFSFTVSSISKRNIFQVILRLEVRGEFNKFPEFFCTGI